MNTVHEHCSSQIFLEKKKKNIYIYIYILNLIKIKSNQIKFDKIFKK